MKIQPVNGGQHPQKRQKKLDYRLQDEYYLFPAQPLVTGEIIRDGQKTNGVVLKGFIATHGDGVRIMKGVT
jgi:hypothetical protein